MLQGVVEGGTGYNAIRVNVAGLPREVVAGGKTGTTNDGADIWFNGFTPNLLATVWFGLDRPQQIWPGATGAGAPAPVWGNFMKRVYYGDPDALDKELQEPTHSDPRAVGGPGCDWRHGSSTVPLGNSPRSGAPRRSRSSRCSFRALSLRSTATGTTSACSEFRRTEDSSQFSAKASRFTRKRLRAPRTASSTLSLTSSARSSQ